MSTKRPPQSNEESYEALQALFLKIAAGDAGLVESDHVWRQVIDNSWFRAEVKRRAERLVGGNVDDPLCDDIAQEVVLQLKGKLSKHCDLGADADKLREHFPGWMVEIIHNAGIDTLRRQLRHKHEPLNKTHAIEGHVPQVDLRLDMAAAIECLENREREVALRVLRKFPERLIAEELHLTRRQVQLSVKKVKAFLSGKLAVYREGI